LRNKWTTKQASVVANCTVHGPSNLGWIVQGVLGLLSTSNPRTHSWEDRFSESHLDIVTGEFVYTTGIDRQCKPIFDDSAGDSQDEYCESGRGGSIISAEK
jgi:hypothetical protein